MIINNSPSADLINESVLKDLSETSFKAEGITLVKLINNFECDVIVRDSKGHRSYLVNLEKNSKFKHLYKILNVKGQKIVSRYQWR